MSSGRFNRRSFLARAAWGLSSRRARVRPQIVGLQEIGYGIVTVLALVIGYRVGP